MSCCHGGCGCEKNKVAPKKKDAHLESREVGKLCPVCDANYLSQDVRLSPLPGDEGITKEYCTTCAPGIEMVRAYLPKCHCGMTIRPRDKYCHYHGHLVCPHSPIACPGWHDYTEKFVEK